MPGYKHYKLKPLESEPLQAYFSNRIQLADIIDAILQQIGPCNIIVSTFSTSEEFLRRIYRLKNKSRILKCSLFCDLKACRKTINLFKFIDSVFDAVYLCENHSKVILFENKGHKISVVTSQNQTRGNRFECGIVTSDLNIFNTLFEEFKKIKSIRLNEFISTPNHTN
ncbi:MAG: C4-dicarboxylate ABC transporter [Muribaculaceae bacterium]